MSCALEHADIADRRREQRRGDGTDTGDRRQTARGFILPRLNDDPLRLSRCLQQSHGSGRTIL